MLSAIRERLESSSESPKRSEAADLDPFWTQLIHISAERRGRNINLTKTVQFTLQVSVEPGSNSFVVSNSVFSFITKGMALIWRDVVLKFVTNLSQSIS